MTDKRTTIESLSEITAQLRGAGKRVVQCHGVFDLLHIGHIRYLQRARRLGDVLVVTVTPDRYVNKGPHRPAFAEQLRLDALAALDCVDYVALNNQATAVEAIRRLRPTIFAKGAEFRDAKTPELLREEQAAAEVGTTVEFIEEVTSSSSQLINTYLSPFDRESEQYLAEFRKQHSADEVMSFIEHSRSLKVLVVGEAIIDEYYYCSAIGRSAKAPIVATKYQTHERFAGGSLAMANHLAAFCGEVQLVSMLGAGNSEEEWIRQRLRDNVTPSFIHKPDSPTIVKRRYHESYFNSTLFAINFLNDDPLREAEVTALCRELERRIDDCDAVVVSDYGHSLLCGAAIGVLSERANFLCVNPQANEANLGFHTISRYSRADYAALALQDLELEYRERGGDLRAMLRDAAERLRTRTMAVTLGKRGCLCYNNDMGYLEAAGLATNVVDRIGAADAFFALSSLCVAVGAPADILAFCGNVAGAQAVAVVGSSPSIDDLTFRRHVESLLK